MIVGVRRLVAGRAAVMNEIADAPLIAVLGALGGSLVTGVASLGGLLHQSRSQGAREHRQRVFERHLAHYERIFATARSAQDAFQGLDAVYEDVRDPADPFLGQILTITADRADASVSPSTGSTTPAWPTWTSSSRSGACAHASYCWNGSRRPA